MHQKFTYLISSWEEKEEGEEGTGSKLQKSLQEWEIYYQNGQKLQKLL